MMYERWAAGLFPGYRPTLADLFEQARERQAELTKPTVVINE